MKKLVSCMFACAIASAAMAQNSNDPKVWGWDFPMYLEINTEVGQEALTCQMHYFELVKKGEGVVKQSMIWYDTTIAEPGKEKTKINNYGDKIEVPNTLIIPLAKEAKAKKGDILLTHHKYHDMQRAIVIDDSKPTEPVVCFLDESWPDKPESTSLPEKQKGVQLKAGSFNVLKEGEFMSGAQVAYKSGSEMKFGKILQVSGDKVLVSTFASRIDCTTKSNCKLISFKQKFKEGDKVSAISADCYEPGYNVVKVDKEHGHVWLQADGSKYTHCFSILDVMK